MASRQELYDRIRNSSKDQVIVDEMIRLGFWPRSTGLPNDPAQDIQRETQLSQQLQTLRTELSRMHNTAYLRKQALKQRLADSRAQRKESKERRELERRERAELWARFKKHQIVYLGEGVSTGLNHRESDKAKLKSLGLPELDAAGHLAEAMGLTVSELRFLSFSRRVSTTTHYVRFEIPKKRGGTRLISAPMPRLKLAQHWILENILNKISVHDAAHGFMAQRSIVTNAQPHVGASVVVNLDLKDFFPTITYRRVKGVFKHMGYSEALCTIFALICTEPEIVKAELDGKTYYVAQSARHLPQGAPTSPMLTNIICRRLDNRLTGLSKKLGFTYTRYADDLTFSSSDEVACQTQVGALLRAVRYIVSESGFIVHPDKTRILRDGNQKEVTGVVVNEKLNVDRKTLRRFRALLFQIERDGIEGKQWGTSPDLLASIEGYANFVAMVNPARGLPLKAQVRTLLNSHGRARHATPATPPTQPSPPEPTLESSDLKQDQEQSSESSPKDGDEKKDKWWKMW